MTLPDLSRAETSTSPFPHFRADEAIPAEMASRALGWLSNRARWRLRVEDFYEQHEIDLTGVGEGGIAPFASQAFIDTARDALTELLPTRGSLEVVGVAAHRLTEGQTIRIHNDHLGPEETHRLVLQLNEGWRLEQGGLLMLFSDDTPESLAEVVMPTHASAFGFRISAASHHAVSTVRRGRRYTVVYTFRETG